MFIFFTNLAESSILSYYILLPTKGCVFALFPLQGFIAYQHLCAQGAWCILWPDFLHKLATKSAMALAGGGADQFLKRLNKLFRMTRGPWGSGKFGRQLQEARQTLADAVRSGQLGESLDTWLAGCARDAGRMPGQFRISELLSTLDSKRGRFQQLPKFIQA